MSINYPDVAYIKGEKILYNIPKEKFRPNGDPQLDIKYDPRVVFLRIIPGLGEDVIEAIINTGYRGIVLEGYGAGGIPYRKRNLLDKIKEIAPKIPVVMTTQAIHDGVDMTRYEVGIKARKYSCQAGEAYFSPPSNKSTEPMILILLYLRL